MIDGPLISTLQNSIHEKDYSDCGFLFVSLTLEKLLKFTFGVKNCQGHSIYNKENEKVADLMLRLHKMIETTVMALFDRCFSEKKGLIITSC
jgi:hypothetical protein